MVSEMYRIPSLDVNESSMNIDPVLRLIKNKKESTLTAFPYDSRFVKALLKDVHVMAIGDSLMRSIYKDLIVMLNGDDLIEEEALRAKQRLHFSVIGRSTFFHLKTTGFSGRLANITQTTI